MSEKIPPARCPQCGSLLVSATRSLGIYCTVCKVVTNKNGKAHKAALGDDELFGMLAPCREVIDAEYQGERHE